MTEHSQVHTKTTETQLYSPVQLDQARLLIKQKDTTYDHYHGTNLYGKIPARNEPLRMLGFTPVKNTLPYDNINYYHVHCTCTLN